jgi:endonuclease YncB( thermonuclease family)
MVREGFAWAFTRFSVDYVGEEAKAKAGRLGVHAHGCAPAWEWRAQQRARNGRPTVTNFERLALITARSHPETL